MVLILSLSFSGEHRLWPFDLCKQKRFTNRWMWQAHGHLSSLHHGTHAFIVSRKFFNFSWTFISCLLLLVFCCVFLSLFLASWMATRDHLPVCFLFWQFLEIIGTFWTVIYATSRISRIFFAHVQRVCYFEINAEKDYCVMVTFIESLGKMRNYSSKWLNCAY